MSAPTQTAGPTKAETLRGGVPLKVFYLDDTSEEVIVRQLPVSKFDDWLKYADNEPARIELVTGKPAGWADNLLITSHEALVAEAERINGDFFGRWFVRRKERVEQYTRLAGTPAAAPPASSPTGSQSAPLKQG